MENQQTENLVMVFALHCLKNGRFIVLTLPEMHPQCLEEFVFEDLENGDFFWPEAIEDWKQYGEAGFITRIIDYCTESTSDECWEDWTDILIARYGEEALYLTDCEFDDVCKSCREAEQAEQ